MRAFAVSTKKYLRPYGLSGSTFTAVANYTNSKTEVYHETPNLWSTNLACNKTNISPLSATNLFVWS